MSRNRRLNPSQEATRDNLVVAGLWLTALLLALAAAFIF